MKKLLYIFFTLLSFAAFGQVGSQLVSGTKYRVNDSTAYQAAAATAHAQGYADIYWNNQATTPHFDVWNGSAYEHVFVFGGSGGGGGGTWGSITGTLSSQTDLQTALNGKQSTITFGTGVQTALGVNVGSAGAPVLFNGAGGTPSSITLTNGTGLPGTAVINTPAGNIAATTAQAALNELDSEKEGIYISSTGTAVQFDTKRAYGLSADETGNITFNSSGAAIGKQAFMIHNSGTEPTFGAQFIKSESSRAYVTSVDNFIYFQYWSATLILYSITQGQ